MSEAEYVSKALDERWSHVQCKAHPRWWSPGASHALVPTAGTPDELLRANTERRHDWVIGRLSNQ